ncbi:MAG: radical SAM protein [Chloroflexi bacterium]|nr:radical SAM protein [Chloroflexota bacterium]MBU1750533.1 radical SAM protein [Chloroflexota bacterium]
MTTIRVSLGTAIALGLSDARADEWPTTAYLMVGERCVRDCAFCAQARTSTARADALSRVTWPRFDEAAVLEALARAVDAGRVRRACFQTTVNPGIAAEVARLARAVRAVAPVPVSASIWPASPDDIGALLVAGVSRVGLALDAASPAGYRAIKGRDPAAAWAFLADAVRCYPGHITTHLIVGLGETEREMVMAIQRAHALGVTVGLFAFTPVRGTALAHQPPPALAHYRRMQVARHLIAQGHQAFAFDDAGRLVDWGLSAAELATQLGDGAAFQTSGCADCNRPYYNERPGGDTYNYARPLTPAQVKAALGDLGAS